MDTTWENDRKIVSAAWSAFAAAIRHSLSGARGGIPPAVIPYLHQVEVLAQDFEMEPEMGPASATLWQDGAVGLSTPSLHDLTGVGRALTEIAVQVAALVFQIAKRYGGSRSGHGFGYGYILVREDVRGDGVAKLDVDWCSFRFEPLDMLEFVYLRAAELGVPAEELAAKKQRRGLAVVPRVDRTPWTDRQKRLLQAALEIRQNVAIGLTGQGEKIAIANSLTVQKLEAFDAACNDVGEEN